MAADDTLKDQLNIVQAAARLVFYQNAGKQRLVNQLALAARRTNHRLGNVQMTLEDAAKAAWVPPKDLLAQLKADSCFKLLMKPGPPGASAQCYVGLDVQKIVSTARGMTRTGYLNEELPPPKGYVDGLHPIRPGQPNCNQFVKFGECAYNERCVYNHPGKPSGNQHKSPQAATHAASSRSENGAVSSAAAAQTSRAPAPLKTAWGAGQVLTGAPTGQQQQQPQRPAWGAAAQTAPPAAPPAAAVMDAGSSSTIPSTPGSVAGPQAMSSAMQAAAHAPQQPWPHMQQQVVQPQQHSQPPPSQAQPAAQPVEQVRQPCHMLLLRGFCPMGANCPYEHPKPAGAGNQVHTVAPIQTADHAASSTERQHDIVTSPLSAQAEPSTPVPAPPAARPQPAAVAAQAPASTAAAGQRTWKDLVAGPRTHQQQQQQEQQQQGGTAASSEASTPRSVPAGHAAKLMGWTDGCLPQLRGAPNCPFFMGTGTCKFMERCVYHHPTAADHPECVARGELPKRYNANNRPSYGRLINHLYRVWDYESCVEAQLKIWLARHLLGRNNPGSQMFSKDACRPALPAQGRGFYWQAMGPYTCSMGEAGEVLHHMWRAQPDEASKQSMPCTKQLRELLTGDPYFEVAVDKKCPSHYWVKLNVDKIKSTLNF